MTGVRLGPYEIVAPLGAGGMGEVYSARDTRLERTVAIKVLPEFAADPQFRERFEREARAISALSPEHLHAPRRRRARRHGIPRHGVPRGRDAGRPAGAGPLPLDEALTFAIRDRRRARRRASPGIVHRDLKPANVMLTKTGAKLLDFGLAKASPRRRRCPASIAPTRRGSTAQGTFVGTCSTWRPNRSRP